MKRWMQGARATWIVMAGLAGGWAWNPAGAAETPAESTVRQAMVEVVAAAARLDAEGILARLDPDPALRYYVQGQSFSHAELSVFLRQSFADMKSQKVIWLESAARELAPDTVLWTSRGRNPVVEAGGREIEYLLAESWVWRKFGGIWKAVHYQESFLEMPSREKCARVEAALASFAAGFKPEARDPQSVMPDLEKFVRGHEDIAGAVFAFAPRQGAGLPVPYVFRRHGELVRKLEPADSYLCCDWYAKPAGSGKLAWSEPYFDTHGAEKMMITCGLPIFDAQGQLQGVLTADVAFY